MRQITIVVCFLLSLYEAHGCNQYMPELDDFVRTRLDAYRYAYNHSSVPLDKDITHTLQDAAFAKANKIPQDKDVDPNCPYYKKYQFYLPDKSTCCGGDCVLTFIQYPGVATPTDLINFQFVVQERECTDPLNTLEKDVDNMMALPEGYKVILERTTSSKWAVYSSNINSCYFVFATADESGDNSVPSDICKYHNSNFTPIPSKSPIQTLDTSKFYIWSITLSMIDQLFNYLYGFRGIAKGLPYSLRALRDRGFLAGNLTSSQTITNP